jgi:hypothetical protein
MLGVTRDAVWTAVGEQARGKGLARDEMTTSGTSVRSRRGSAAVK